MGKSGVEKITLQVEAPKMTGGGLAEAKAQLMAIDLLIARINKGMAGLAEPSVIKKSATQVKRELEALFKGKPVSTKPEDLAKAMGLDPKAFRSFVTQANAELRKLMSGGEFRNLTAASKGLAKFTAQQSRTEAETRKAVAGLLQGGVRKDEVQSVTKAILSGGPIILEVPAASVQAVLVGGPVQVSVPGSVASSGAVVSASGGSGGGTGSAGPGAPDIGGASIPDVSSDELRRRVTQTRRSIKTEITRALGALDTIAETFNKAGDVTKTVTTTRAGERRLQQIKERLGLIKQGLFGSIEGSFTGVRSTDLRARAALQRKAAGEIELLAGSGLSELGGEGMEGSFRAQAAKLRQNARKSARQAALAARKEAAEMEKAEARDQAERSRRTAAELRGAQTADQSAFRAREEYHNWWGRQVKAQEGAAKIAELEAKGFVKSREVKGTRTTAAGEVQTRSTVYTMDRGGVRTAITATAELAKNGEVLAYRFSEVNRALKATRAEASAAGRNFFQNTAHVTAWAASVGALYGGINLVETSLNSLIQTGLQTARLGQVFQGIGGSASLLRDNVLALAAAHGRDAGEAIDAAIRWSRLGLSRVQVNEAVRVSLIAANVAELDAASATEKLQAVMAAYSLSVVNLSGMLGQLNQISNTFNVTNKDMLDGLSRTASVAKQVGVPLSELMGLIGATVGMTGQTGANIGNAVKSFATSLSNPAIQKFLKQEFQIDVRSGSGDVQEMSKTLSDLFVRYQALTKAEQEHLLVQTAGKTQSSRVTAMLDSYIQAQVLAINAQLNLNSAELENAKIKATLAASLKGVATEWERLVAAQGENGLTGGMVQVTQAFRHLLSVFNSPVGSVALTGMLALLAVLSARLLVTGLQMRSMGANTSFVGRSMTQLRGAVASLSLTMRKAHHDMTMMWRTSESLGQYLGRRMTGSFVSLGGAMRFAGNAIKGVAAGLITLAPELAIIYGATWAFNQAMEALGMSSEAAERKLAGFNAEAERASGAAGAAAQAARLFATVQRSFPNLRDRDRNLKTMRERGLITTEEENALKTAADAGQFAKADEIFERKKREQSYKAMLERARSRAEDENGRREQKAEVERLKKRPFVSKAHLKEQEKVLADMENKRSQMILEDSEGINPDVEEMLASDIKHLAFLERQKLVLESIDEIYAHISSNPLDQAAAKLAATQAKLNYLRALEIQLMDTAKARASDEALRKQQLAEAEEEVKIRQLAVDAERKKYADVPGLRHAMNMRTPSERALQDAEGVRDALRSSAEGPEEAGRRILVRKAREEAHKLEASLMAQRAEFERQQREQERHQINLDYAKSEAESFNYGYDAEDRVRNRKRGIEGLMSSKMKALEDAPPGSVEAHRLTLQLVQHTVDLREAYLEKQRLGLQLHKEEQDLIRSKIKEFQKSLITAGPGELLKKLAATQLGKQGMTSGAFFALDPSMREELSQVYPGQYSPDVAEIRAQRRRLGRPDSPATMEKTVAGHNDLVGQLMSVLSTFKVSAASSQVIQTAAAAQQLNALTNSAGNAASALQTLQGPIQNLVNQVNAAAQQIMNAMGSASGGPFLPNAGGYAPGASGGY